MVRTWKWAALGSGEPPRRRSMATDATPCWARNIAVDSPTKPPPAMTTGVSSRLSIRA